MFEDVPISDSKIDLLAPKPFASKKFRRRTCPFSSPKSPNKIKKEIITEPSEEKKTVVAWAIQVAFP